MDILHFLNHPLADGLLDCFNVVALLCASFRVEDGYILRVGYEPAVKEML